MNTLIIGFFFSVILFGDDFPTVFGPYVSMAHCQEAELPYRRLGYMMDGCSLMAINLEIKESGGPNK